MTERITEAEMTNISSNRILEDISESSWTLGIRNNESIINTHGLSNEITTTKYSLLTWLPKSLWEQFRRVANSYFLFISILMLIGTYATYIFVSPLDPYSTVLTLIFVLMVTSIKEGVEDLQRARSDKEENSRSAIIVQYIDGNFVERIVETKDIKGGDIVKLTGTCPVPVDMLIMLTSLHDDGNQCYIETSNIDGETNLKMRQAPVAFQPFLANGTPNLQLFSGSVTAERPNKNIHSFHGTASLQVMTDTVPLSAENVILRGSLFSNTDWLYGVAIYTGQETKLQMNSRVAPSKMSKLEGYLNRAIVIIFFSQVVLVSISVLSLFAMGFYNASKLPYIYPDGLQTGSVLPMWLEQWLVFFLLYNNFIPISLYVTIELVNIGQAWLITSDAKLYDEILDCPCLVRASNLVQEIGSVTNIFSDKTGTLTRNEMKFVKFVVDGAMYDLQGSHAENGEFNTTSVIMGRAKEKNFQYSKLHNMMQCLVTCHTVVREKNGTYRSESPDELALVEGIEHFECRLLERGTAVMNVMLFGMQQTYEVLAVNAFNADRKRMSVLLRDTASNEYVVMCKGADNVMLPLCCLDAMTRRNVDKSLFDLACLGLRTLCISHKKLSQNQALSWMMRYKSASSAMLDRASRLSLVATELETELTLLGVTAIEDKLQDEVPEVISDLARAGIVLWMLTGDKEETAINIAHSCNLILADSNVKSMTRVESSREFSERLDEVYNSVVGQVDMSDRSGQDIKIVRECVVVVDGPSLVHFDDTNKDDRAKLLKICQRCRSVIACRLTPIQKQQLVSLVKIDSYPRTTTLSIGDGANDVPMIREADVGVGIFGKEGRQAANSADFAIGQFKFLRRLLLVHGRWNYVRQSQTFLYSMHKNMVITLTLFWYSYYTALSGTSMYESWVYTAFNFALGLPIIFYGILDRDLSAEFSLKHPEVYATSRNNVYLQISTISYWILNAILYAMIICLVFYYVLAPTYLDYSVYEMGTMVFVGLVMALQGKIAFMHHQWAYPQLLAMAISVGGLFLYLVIISDIMSDFTYISTFVYMQGIFWLFGLFTVPVFASLIDVIYCYGRMFLNPHNEMLYREKEHKNIQKALNEPQSCIRGNMLSPVMNPVIPIDAVLSCDP